MVADLGLGKSMEVSSRLTVIAGTPSFVAPEQAQGEPLDPRADQYSLAALTYLMLAGRAAVLARVAVGRGRARPAAAALDARAALPARGRGRRTPRARRRPRGPVARRRVVRRRRWRPRSARPSAGDAGQPWLPLDPHLTQPGAPPSLKLDDRPLPGAGRRLRRTRRRVLAAGWRGAGPGRVGRGRLRRRRSGPAPTSTVTDDESLPERDRPERVGPAVADRRVARRRAPTTTTRRVSVGTAADWTDPGRRPGRLRRRAARRRAADRSCPQHPECATPATGRRRRSDWRRVGDRRLHRLPGRRDRRAGRPGHRPTSCSGCRCAATRRPRPTGCSTASTCTACDVSSRPRPRPARGGRPSLRGPTRVR